MGRGGKIECPLLDERQKYIAFGGNGHRRGQGYRILGETHGGWLFKCGFDIADDLTGVATSCRQFLGNLDQLEELFGFRVAAVNPRTLEWHELQAMRAMAKREFGWEDIDRLHIRIYAPATYLDQVRAYFAKRGGFEGIPGRSDESESTTLAKLDLGARMKLVGLRQRDVADETNISQPFLSSVLNGRKPWPTGLKDQVEAVVLAAESSTADRLYDSRRAGRV